MVASVLKSSTLVQSLVGPASTRSVMGEHAGLHNALFFHIPVVLWIDILSCISTRTRPQLPYETWLDATKIDLQLVMGCRNWAMKAIGDLASLDIETRNRVYDKTEFIRRLGQIEQSLEAGIAQLPEPRLDATAIFAAAALVQARLIQAARQTCHSHQATVDRVLQEIQLAQKVVTARQIPWPICVAGCVASGEQRVAFESILSRAPGPSQIGNCRTVLEVMRRCWGHTDSANSGLWDCGRIMPEMGTCVLLI